MACIHIGAPQHNSKKFMEFRDWILHTPNTYTMLNGDILNCAIIGSKSDSYSELMPLRDAKKAALDALRPLAAEGKILGMTRGNHEDRIWRSVGDDPLAEMADILDVPYHPEGLFFNVKLGHVNKGPAVKGRISYTFYMTHGVGGGRTKGSKANVAARPNELILADIYITAHTHFATTFKDKFFVPDVRHSKIDAVTRTYVSAGAFLDWGEYSERMMLSPSKLGAPRIRLSGVRKDCHVSI